MILNSTLHDDMITIMMMMIKKERNGHYNSDGKNDDNNINENNGRNYQKPHFRIFMTIKIITKIGWQLRYNYTV